MKPYYDKAGITIYHADVMDGLACLADASVQCVVTSPPYWGLRDYGIAGQLGLEPTPEAYVEKMVGIFHEVGRVLRKDGTLWLNMGDCYAHSGACGGSSPDGPRRPRATDRVAQQKMNYSIPSGLKPKDLVGMPWRIAFALQADGWWLRQDIIWHKRNPMPESVTDRCTKAHEYIFLMTKSARYYFDHDAMREPSDYGQPNSPESIKSPYGQGYTRRAPTGWDQAPGGHRDRTGRYASKKHSIRDGIDTKGGGQGSGEMTFPVGVRNRRSVWTVSTVPYPDAHFATFPPKLIEPCIRAGAKADDTVLDPFVGSGTTLAAARDLGCKAIGIELNADYCELAVKRLAQGVLEFPA